MIQKLLIANRGEIACRIARTARRMGIATVAVYSEADAGAAHVVACDQAICIGPAPARESYLHVPAILAAARSTGADAIHPGYGFLSENAGFARAVAEAGLIFVGPSPESIEAMGEKAAARQRMAKAGVPVVPGYDGDDQSEETLKAEADRIGRPLMIKASAGGGGKGMRVVSAGDDFTAALQSARREAESAFGNGRMILERYVERPRHIEIQVFGDRHGNLVHLYERDCSLQRRHQKVMEEAPAPNLPPAIRAAMADRAVAAARAIDYHGAGTVEMLLGADGGYYFMEMNTRLQVEHPVTETITGLDLVEWQLRIAAGESLPLRQDEIPCIGHAIEVRLYAEDAAAEDRPQTGRLDHLTFPMTGEGCRIDTGVRAGDDITPYYDPMIAKLIASGPNRAVALARLRQMLAETEIVPLVTNLPLLMAIAAHPGVAAGGMDTGFIPAHRSDLLPEPNAEPPMIAAACLAERLSPPKNPASPWALADGFRVNAPATETFSWRIGANTQDAQLIGLAETLALLCDSVAYPITGPKISGQRISFGMNGRFYSFTVLPLADGWQIQGTQQIIRLHRPLDPAQTADSTPADDRIVAPMPGRITGVLVKSGDRVTRGQRLMTMEAMKMEHAMTAPTDGEVETVSAEIGSLVSEGQVLIRLILDAADAA